MSEFSKEKLLEQQTERVIKIGFYKAMGILIGAILTSGIVGAFTAYTTLNSDHFLLASVSAQVDKNTRDLSDRQQYIDDIKVIQTQIGQIQTNISDLKDVTNDNNNKLNVILGRLQMDNINR